VYCGSDRQCFVGDRTSGVALSVHWGGTLAQPPLGAIPATSSK
jgi:hypothetical protein